MMLTEQVFAHAAVLAGDLEEKEQNLLKVLCTASSHALEARLREGIIPEDCRAEFIAAASLHALAALGTAGNSAASISEFKAGDLTVKQGNAGSDTASRCLEKQADLLMEPYLKDRFSFTGV